MSEFRIIQTQALSQLLPYEVEERRRVWYLPWPVWRPLKKRAKDYKGSRVLTEQRFRTPQEARIRIEQMMSLRAKQQAKRQAHQQRTAAERRQREQLPRVVEVLRTSPAY
jgi:hypothetical protein